MPNMKLRDETRDATKLGRLNHLVIWFFTLDWISDWQEACENISHFCRLCVELSSNMKNQINSSFDLIYSRTAVVAFYLIFFLLSHFFVAFLFLVVFFLSFWFCFATKSN